MNILKVLPDLSKSKHLGLFHRAAAGPWGADEIERERAPRIPRERLEKPVAAARREGASAQSPAAG